MITRFYGCLCGKFSATPEKKSRYCSTSSARWSFRLLSGRSLVQVQPGAPADKPLPDRSETSPSGIFPRLWEIPRNRSIEGVRAVLWRLAIAGAATLTLAGCASHPAIRNAAIGVGTAIMLGAGGHHHQEPDVRIPRVPDCFHDPRSCR